jgi:5-methylcytosine-specific restriction endonuclease McrA
MKITTRSAAKKRGQKMYFTGEPCPNGHRAERFVSNYGCSACLREKALARYHRDPDRHRDRFLVTLVRIKPRTKDRGDLSLDDWLAIKERQAYRCACCGTHDRERRLGIDHVLPICKGGTNDPANLQALCWPCNRAKGRKHIDYRSTHERDLRGLGDRYPTVHGRVEELQNILPAVPRGEEA